jgi:hypothetical protein
MALKWEEQEEQSEEKGRTSRATKTESTETGYRTGADLLRDHLNHLNHLNKEGTPLFVCMIA